MTTECGTTVLSAMVLYMIVTTACIDATAAVDDFFVRLTVTRTTTTVVRTVTHRTILEPHDWLMLVMNNSEDDANHVDNASTTERWLSNLVVHSFTPTALASSFAERDARICFAPHAGNNTNSLIAVPYSAVEMIIGLTLILARFTPYWIRSMNTLERQ